MHIRVGYDIRFELPRDLAMITLLEVHPSRRADLRTPDTMQLEPNVTTERYLDECGNRCCRFVAPKGMVWLRSSSVIEDSGEPDPEDRAAIQMDVDRLPAETLRYLLSSRYCEVDLLSEPAWDLFGQTPPGWRRVQAVCDWVHQHVTFGYQFARRRKTANDVFEERNGVCRDFQHLAIAFCRSLNIPARYATGYLGDIGVPPAPFLMDFNAWFEAYLGGAWRTFDARHNQRRIARVLVARGRDATDVAITTHFGEALLTNFKVITEEVSREAVQCSDHCEPNDGLICGT